MALFLPLVNKHSISICICDYVYSLQVSSAHYLDLDVSFSTNSDSVSIRHTDDTCCISIFKYWNIDFIYENTKEDLCNKGVPSPTIIHCK